jgi:hypothetical protein
LLESTLEAMTEEEAGELAKSIFSLYTSAAEAVYGGLHGRWLRSQRRDCRLWPFSPSPNGLVSFVWETSLERIVGVSNPHRTNGAYQLPKPPKL